jgi:hypothetical protein
VTVITVGLDGNRDRVHAFVCGTASPSGQSSGCHLSPDSSPRRVADPVAVPAVFGDLPVGLRLSRRDGGLSLLLIVGIPRYGGLVVFGPISRREFDDTHVLLHREFDDAECQHRLDHQLYPGDPGLRLQPAWHVLELRRKPECCSDANESLSRGPLIPGISFRCWGAKI